MTDSLLVDSTPARDPRAREDHELLVRYRRHGDLAAREELVRRMLPFVHRLARRYHRGGESLEDLVQVGSVGLVKAIERFDPDLGKPFVRYAAPTILGEIRRHFRDTGWAAHVPRGVQERVLEVKQAVDRLSSELGRSPSAAEIAQHLECDTEQVVEAMEAATAYTASSLDAPLRSDDDEGATYADAVGADDEGYALVDEVQTVLPALSALPERERRILHLRFVEDLTQSEIAERIGVSQMHVSRLLRRALERVRTIAGNDRRTPPLSGAR